MSQTNEYIVAFRQKVTQNNTDHLEMGQCIAYGCQNRIEFDSWDNKVLCLEHDLIFRYWFYELDGAKYCPETFEYPTMNPLPKPAGSDGNMMAYRKRYCDWMASLDQTEYLRILLWSVH